MDMSDWNITETEHGTDCAGCQQSAETAAMYARVTGSIGGGLTNEFQGPDGNVVSTHSARVERRSA